MHDFVNGMNKLNLRHGFYMIRQMRIYNILTSNNLLDLLGFDFNI